MQSETGAAQPRQPAPLALVVNGEPRALDVPLSSTLLEVLRGALGLTGTKEACGRGECGACTVLVGGVPQLACITLAGLVRAPVTTIEGLAEAWSDLRRAFAEHGGFQCGFCTSGQIVHAAAILGEGLPAEPAAAEAHLRHRLSGNICRCTGYGGIIAAIMSVAARRGLVKGGAGE